MPVDSPYPRIEIPEVDLWQLLFERKDRAFPDDKSRFLPHPGSRRLKTIPANPTIFTVIYQDAETSRSYTYGQVKSTALEFGKGLKATWEWKKGDVLAVFSPNSIDIPALMWGTHWAGGVITTANPAYTADELAHQLKDTKAKVLAVQMSSLAVGAAAAKKAGIPEDRIILIGDEKHPTSKHKHFTSIQNISRSTRYLRTRLNPDEDLAFLVYSSGTTGLPKGVRLTHKNIVSNILQLTAGEGGNLTWDGGIDGKGDRLLAFLPFFHIYGTTQTPIYLCDLISNHLKNRFDLFDPQGHLFRPSSLRDGSLRPGALVRPCTELQNHILLHCAAGRPTP
jgi:long-subunit acyl-CoA synthetase (AMP-forming)